MLNGLGEFNDEMNVEGQVINKFTLDDEGELQCPTAVTWINSQQSTFAVGYKN